MTSLDRPILTRLTATAFHAAFRAGLTRLLERPTQPLNELVLVLANAVALDDSELFAQVRAHYEAAAPSLAPADRASDDAAVLDYALGSSRPHRQPRDFVHRRTTPAGWQVLASELRTFRPRREAAKPAGALHQPFDPGRFNFGRVQQEIFLRPTVAETELAFYYQKFPLAAYHFMVVPTPAASREQFLRPADHPLIWELAAQLRAALPGALVAYNSLGAFASINHLHFHVIPDGDTLPIWHRLQDGRYPLAADVYHDVTTAWHHIDRLQQAGQTFNLLYRPGQVVVIARRPQGTYDQPDWTSGMAWLELAGREYVTSQAAFDTLTDADIETALQHLAPS